LATLVLLVASCAPATVVINEFMAASSERRLSWDSNGVPKLGSGVEWMEPGFTASGWTNILLPAGYGFSGLATDLSGPMRGKAPSLYLRKEFVVASDQGGSTNQLVLSVQYNDGFVAYLNGRQIARANCGFSNHFMYASQPAYNVSTNAGVVDVAIGVSADLLLPGTNLLAIQAHNAEQPSTVSVPEHISRHLLTSEFRINAGLREVVGTNLVEILPLGAAGGLWQSWVGRAEPSGGVVDPGLVTRTFTAPQGQEDDYEQPAEFSDWIELYNDGASAADISGWSLSDDASQPGKWRFPTNTVLPGHGYLIVMCDDRDEANAPSGPAMRLHTNFKLGDDGEYLALFNEAGQFVDGFQGYPPQVSFCSYGRDPENPAMPGFLATASPGAANISPCFQGRVEPPHFTDLAGSDLKGGIYLGQTPTLCLTASTAEVKFGTLDGSEPTAANGLIYANPLVLNQSNDKTGVVVRARAFLPGWLPSAIETHTYLLRQPSLLTNAPTLLLTGDAGKRSTAQMGFLQFLVANSLQWTTERSGRPLDLTRQQCSRVRRGG
jgi:hypothetical protein